MLFSDVPKAKVCIELAAGTGSNLPYLLGNYETIYCVDPSDQMLAKLTKKFNHEVVIPVCKQAEEFLNLKADCVVVSFGFRNFYDRQKVLENITRYLEPGGYLLVMDVFKPKSIIDEFFLKTFFSFFCIPLGWLITGSRESYEYFFQSIFSFVTYNKFIEDIEKLGFKTLYAWSFLSLGILKLVKK